ncbi:MAG: AarF/ABC1/UbiB kinase family protein [Bacteroidota bacterium]
MENKETPQIPTSKIKRASRFVKTGFKVGGNYVKHYSKKLLEPELERETLDQANAEDIYDTLSELKGSALKVAQMLSMDKGALPAAFAEKFAEAQHKAPAMSGPLVNQTFRKYLGKAPHELYDEFEAQATHAASIGQVHKAYKDGQPLAVKIQYPGVKESVVSDLNIVRPFARRLLGFKDQDIELYFQEVKERLIEETDYELELKRGSWIGGQCSQLENLYFPTYFPELSGAKVISMSWMEGLHLDDFMATNPSQEVLNKIGQALWDFYNFQVHELKVMHADAHPGNYLFLPEGEVVVLDFGCVKEIPEDFYDFYLGMIQPGVVDDEERFTELCYQAEIIFESDSEADKEMYKEILRSALDLLCKPFHAETFDFGDKAYFDGIYEYGEEMAKKPELRQSKVPRGSKDAIYLNRTYFGLYSILHELKAEVQTRRFMPILG